MSVLEGNDLRTAVESINPSVALDIGYSFHLASSDLEGCAVRESAESVVRKFNTLETEATQRGVEAPESIFFLQLRACLTSFARGITRRKQALQRELLVAEQERVEMVRKFADTQRMIGFLKGGFQILLIGGFGFALVMTIVTSKKFEDNRVGEQPGYYSLVFALGLALIGSFCKSWIAQWRMKNIHTRYEGAIRKANRSYAASARVEYRLAWEAAQTAWRTLTGKNPPDLMSYDIVFARLMDSNTDESVAQRPNTSVKERVRAIAAQGLASIKGRLGGVR